MLDFNADYKTLDGEPMVFQGKPLCFRRVCVETLGAALPGDEKLSYETKVERDRLAERVYNYAMAQITPVVSMPDWPFKDGDIKLIREIAPKMWAARVVGQLERDLLVALAGKKTA
jgi:hypothetical protein